MTAIRDVEPPQSFPFMRAEGSPFEIGRSHGKAFGDRVLGSIGVYRDKFEKIGLAWPKALELAARSGDYLRSLDPALAQELDGIAEG